MMSEYSRKELDRIRLDALNEWDSRDKIIAKLVDQLIATMSENMNLRDHLSGLREGRIPALMAEKDEAFKQLRAVVAQRDEARAAQHNADRREG